MVQMGVITREQGDKAMGCEWAVAGLTEDSYVYLNEKPAPSCKLSDGLNIYFSEDPIGGFKTADDVFAWLDEILDQENG